MEIRSLHEQYTWLTDDGWIQCVKKLSEQLKCYWNARDIFFTGIMYLVHNNNKTWCKTTCVLIHLKSWPALIECVQMRMTTQRRQSSWRVTLINNHRMPCFCQCAHKYTKCLFVSGPCCWWIQAPTPQNNSSLTAALTFLVNRSSKGASIYDVGTEG